MVQDNLDQSLVRYIKNNLRNHASSRRAVQELYMERIAWANLYKNVKLEPVWFFTLAFK